MQTKTAALILIGAHLLLQLNCVVSADSDGEKIPTDYRLPTHIRPSKYNLAVIPYLSAVNGKQAFTFDGIAIITLSTDQPQIDEIVLHQKGLTIANIRLTERDTDFVVDITETPFVFETDKLTLKLATSLVPKRNYLLRFIYTGPLNSDMFGFYRSSYTENG